MIQELIKGIEPADVIDAMSQLYSHKCHLINFQSPDANKVLFGQAVTIGFMPVRKDFMDPKKHSLGPLFYKSIAKVEPEGKVLVMSSGGHPDISLGGGTKLSRLRNHKMAGILCDGRLRDFEDLKNYPIAVYCKGETLRAGGNLIQPYTFNEPVIVDDVTIIPGDYIFATISGAAVIPENDIEKVLMTAHKILKMTSNMAEMMKTEKSEDILTKGANEI